MTNINVNTNTLDDHELLISSNGYYYPFNPVYSDIKLEKYEDKYIVKNIYNYIKKKTIL
jgi:hypothetical protein